MSAPLSLTVYAPGQIVITYTAPAGSGSCAEQSAAFVEALRLLVQEWEVATRVVAMIPPKSS